PTVFTSRSKSPWVAKEVSRWSKKPTPVSIEALPEPSRFRVISTVVSFVERSRRAVRVTVPPIGWWRPAGGRSGLRRWPELRWSGRWLRARHGRDVGPDARNRNRRWTEGRRQRLVLRWEARGWRRWRSRPPTRATSARRRPNLPPSGGGPAIRGRQSGS